MSWLFIACIPFLLVPLSLPPEDLKSGVQLSLGLALIWVTLSLLMPFACSRLCTKAAQNRSLRRQREQLDRYTHWGMEGEVLWNQPRNTWVMLLVAGAISVVFTALFALPSLVDAGILPDGSSESYFSKIKFLRSDLVIWLLYVIASVFMGYQSSLGDRRDAYARLEMFESLRPVFRNRFTVTEILSMRECLRVAPRIFWEEYTNLPAVQVNEATNRKFKERAAPYQARRGEVTQRTMLLVAVAAVLLAVPTLLYVLLEGTLVASFTG